MKKLNPTMFREYDIRGKINKNELNEESVARIAKAYATFLSKLGIKKTILGYDYREISQTFHDIALTNLLAHGQKVIDIGMCLTPMLYSAQYHYQARGGMMITASHNPSDWSGFKLACGYSATLGPKEIKEVQQLANQDLDKTKEKGEVTKKDFLSTYKQDLIKRISLRRKLKVVVNTGNGTAGPIILAVLKGLNVEVVPLYTNLDWSFPRYFPNPSVVEMMADTGRKVKSSAADIGIAIDGDGDRLGVTDEKGNIVWPDKFLILLAREVLEQFPGSKIIFDVKASRSLAEDILAHGGKPIMEKTGHSYIKARMRKEKAPLAGEMSGHIFYNKPIYYGFDDAIFAALKLIQCLSKYDKPFSALFDDVPSYFSSPALQVSCPDEKKYQIVDSLKDEFIREGYQVITISGVRVEFPDGWGLVRASSNLPVLGLRFEAKTKKRLNEIKELFKKKLAKFPEVGEKWESG